MKKQKKIDTMRQAGWRSEEEKVEDAVMMMMMTTAGMLLGDGRE